MNCRHRWGLWLASLTLTGCAHTRTQPAAQPRNYVIPAVEIVGFDLALNLFDRAFLGPDYRSNLESIRENLQGPWVIDHDPYGINQFGHPYQGSIYHGFARTTGHNYWISAVYTFAGSALWEIAGEVTPPSRNDQIASGIAGSFFGEALFRIAKDLRDSPTTASTKWRRATAAVVSPTLWFNRAVFRHRYDPVPPMQEAVVYRRAQIGGSFALQNEAGATLTTSNTEALLDLTVEAGSPGKPDYSYTRPFDHMVFQATASSATGFENIVARGSLYAAPYQVGGRYRGVWGLYGSYDYLAPQLFRVSSTALSLGTSGQWSRSPSFALQATALAGGGYAAVGTLRGEGEGDHHYGLTPHATVATRFIFGNRAAIDLTGREYFVSDVGSRQSLGHDNIARGEAQLTVRLHRSKAIAARYSWTRRDATYPDLGNRTQTRATLGVFFALLGSDRFGAVEW